MQFRITICGDIDGDLSTVMPILQGVRVRAHAQVQDPDMEGIYADKGDLPDDVAPAEISGVWSRLETRG
jgi:hypothetical protein